MFFMYQLAVLKYQKCLTKKDIFLVRKVVFILLSLKVVEKCFDFVKDYSLLLLGKGYANLIL